MLKAWCDGACEPKNPGGNMGIGAIVMREDEILFQHSQYVPAHPNNSNNVAEYMAFISILDFLEREKLNKEEIIVHGDSKLVMEQMGGTWRIKFGNYTKLARAAKARLPHYPLMRFQWIPREENTLADELSKTPMLENGVMFRLQPVESNGIKCPFCNESGFDKAGLKYHLVNYCKQFDLI